MSLYRTTKALPGKCVDFSETANSAHCPKTAWIFRDYGKRHSFAIARLPDRRVYFSGRTQQFQRLTNCGALPDSHVAVPLPMGEKRERGVQARTHPA